MTTVDIIIQMFCIVDDEMKEMPKHTQAKLYPSELVTIGLLFALKGGYFRLCAKGTWNERMRVETALSMVTVVCDLKRIHHRVSEYIQARLASVVAMFNVLLTLYHRLHPDADPFQMRIAEFSL